MREPAFDPSALLDTERYAPNFRLEVGGQVLSPTTLADVLSLRVDMDIDNLDRFELSLSNWDDFKLQFKYSDSSLFDFNRPVTVSLGYADRLVRVMHGLVESLSPQFPESGSPTLSVGGTSSMSRLRGRRPDPQSEQRKFTQMADHEIAQLIAERNRLRAVVTPSGPRHEVVWQRDLDDALFLMERAKRIDFDVYVQPDPQSGEDTLYFIKPKAPSGPQRRYSLEWGQSLGSFTPKINSARQVSKVTVRGWNPLTKQVFQATADASSLPDGGGRSGPSLADGNKMDQLVDAPVTSQAEAEQLAKSLLLDKAYQFITGEGRVIGLPDLRPGDEIELKGLGSRFSGTYYVKTVSHSLGGNGFLTSFGVRRIHDGGTR